MKKLLNYPKSSNLFKSWPDASSLSLTTTCSNSCCVRFLINSSDITSESETGGGSIADDDDGEAQADMIGD